MRLKTLFQFAYKKEKLETQTFLLTFYKERLKRCDRPAYTSERRCNSFQGLVIGESERGRQLGMAMLSGRTSQPTWHTANAQLSTERGAPRRARGVRGSGQGVHVSGGLGLGLGPRFVSRPGPLWLRGGACAQPGRHGTRGGHELILPRGRSQRGNERTNVRWCSSGRRAQQVCLCVCVPTAVCYSCVALDAGVY
jgi:hypothetical protein